MYLCNTSKLDLEGQVYLCYINTSAKNVLTFVYPLPQESQHWNDTEWSTSWFSFLFTAFTSPGVPSWSADCSSRCQSRQSSSQSLKTLRPRDCKTRWFRFGAKIATWLWRHQLWRKWCALVSCTRDNFRRSDWSTSWHVGVWCHIVHSSRRLPTILERQRRETITVYSAGALQHAFTILGQCVRWSQRSRSAINCCGTQSETHSVWGVESSMDSNGSATAGTTKARSAEELCSGDLRRSSHVEIQKNEPQRLVSQTKVRKRNS